MDNWKAVVAFFGFLVVLAISDVAYLFYQASVQRFVFEASPSYVHGKIMHITQLRYEYLTAKSPTEKENLRLLILSEAASAPFLPNDLKQFIKEIK